MEKFGKTGICARCKKESHVNKDKLCQWCRPSKNVLIAREKYGTRVFDISTPEKREFSYLALFNSWDSPDYNYYSDLRDVKSQLYYDAKKGDAHAAERIIRMRQNYEYERTEILEVENW